MLTSIASCATQFSFSLSSVCQCILRSRKKWGSHLRLSTKPVHGEGNDSSALTHPPCPARSIKIVLVWSKQVSPTLVGGDKLQLWPGMGVGRHTHTLPQSPTHWLSPPLCIKHESCTGYGMEHRGQWPPSCRSLPGKGSGVLGAGPLIRSRQRARHLPAWCSVPFLFGERSVRRKYTTQKKTLLLFNTKPSSRFNEALAARSPPRINENN